MLRQRLDDRVLREQTLLPVRACPWLSADPTRLPVGKQALYAAGEQSAEGCGLRPATDSLRAEGAGRSRISLLHSIGIFHVYSS
jgi:hypothetical protein